MQFYCSQLLGKMKGVSWVVVELGVRLVVVWCVDWVDKQYGNVICENFMYEVGEVGDVM